MMKKMRVLIALMALLLTPMTVRADTIISGTVCNNTCLNYSPGDDTPDYLGLFGPVFGDLMSRPFTLDISATGYSLTINGHTLTFSLNDPHYSISFTDPLLVSFAPGAALFRATGANPFGFAVAEAEFLCDPPPAVPEPATWALFLMGFAFVGGHQLLRRRRVRKART
jgi:PEP-CTERM motif